MGYYYCLVEDVTLGKIFIAIYGVLATYFSCVMIRLMLTLAPVVCIIAAIGISEIMRKAGDSVREMILSYDEPDEEKEELELKAEVRTTEYPQCGKLGGAAVLQAFGRAAHNLLPGVYSSVHTVV